MNKLSNSGESLFKVIIQLLSEYGVSLDHLMGSELYKNLDHNPTEFPNRPSSGLILNQARILSGDQEFCLKLGRKLTVSHFGIFGFALLSCKNLSHVMRLLVRYEPLLNLGPKWELLEASDTITLRTPNSYHDPHGHNAIMETVFSAFCEIGKFLLFREIIDGEVHFDFPPPSYSKNYSKYFSMPIFFGQADCRFELKRSDMEEELHTANPKAHIIFQQQCEALLREVNRGDNLASSVRRILMVTGSSFPMISDVAEQLGLSRRTLRRRLKKESQSFSSISDEVRNILAKTYLESTELTIFEIAELLNFSESASFRRAFKRWNSMSPQDYRRQIVYIE